MDQRRGDASSPSVAEPQRLVPAQLKAFAFQSNVPLAEYLRDMVHDHILERGGTFRERGAALRALINAGKAWVIANHECVAVAAGLPGKERHAELVSRIRGAIAFSTL